MARALAVLGAEAPLRHVADLAGLTNREIAQALFVSTKTIEAQLSHAYLKLGVRSRGRLGGGGQNIRGAPDAKPARLIDAARHGGSWPGSGAGEPGAGRRDDPRRHRR